MLVTPEPQTLILVDLQRSFVEGPTALPGNDRLLAVADAQRAAARAAGALVVHVQNDGTAATLDEPGTRGWELVLSPDATDEVVRKNKDSAFVGTGLHELLRDYGVTAVSVCGVMSEMCVAATARSALELGYGVVLAHDAHATYPVPGFGDEPEVPADQAARVAEWSLGDEVHIVPASADITFRECKSRRLA